MIAPPVFHTAHAAVFGDDAVAFVEKFTAKIQSAADPTACWLWRGTIADTGYGLIYARRRLYAHRVSYQLAHGVLPRRALVCRRCDNPPCVNPAHLFLGDHKTNAQDMVSKGRSVAQRRAGTGWSRGARNGRAKLSAERVAAIRALSSVGGDTVGLSRLFDVSPSQIAKILRGECWT